MNISLKKIKKHVYYMVTMIRGYEYNKNKRLKNNV